MNGKNAVLLLNDAVPAPPALLDVDRLVARARSRATARARAGWAAAALFVAAAGGGAAATQLAAERDPAVVRTATGEAPAVAPAAQTEDGVLRVESLPPGYRLLDASVFRDRVEGVGRSLLVAERTRQQAAAGGDLGKSVSVSLFDEQGHRPLPDAEGRINGYPTELTTVQGQPGWLVRITGGLTGLVWELPDRRIVTVWPNNEVPEHDIWAIARSVSVR